MKNLSFIVFAIAIVLLGSCNPSKNIDPVNTTSDVIVNFATVYDGTRIVQNQEIYDDIANEKFSVSLFMYYISHITLVKANGEESKVENYDLINAFNADEYSNAKVTMPIGTYTKMKFYLGIPQPQNSQASSIADLNVSLGMAWTWSFGYIFFKHEGTFSNATEGIVNKGISYHLGTDAALKTVELPLNLTLDGATKTVNINLDLKKIYNNSSNLFKDGSSRHSGTQDRSWIGVMSDQIKNAFSIQ